ncbi:hypothetical protein [Sphingopyxis sp.]|uniref:hypothetical protein n=1 Tax=Sphingopyxis sp. TaxID=1908224 RepID=UPI003BAC21E9
MIWHRAAIAATVAFCGVLPSGASAAEPVCGAIIAVQDDVKPDPAFFIQAVAVISRTLGPAAIQRADTKSWRVAASGTPLLAGDRVCATGANGWTIVRGQVGRETRIDAASTPLIVDGPPVRKFPVAARDFIASLDWPSLAELTAIERSLTGSGRRRGGVTRGMSIGSTPRAVYLAGDSALGTVPVQLLDRKLANVLWGWCGEDQSGDVLRAKTVTGTLENFSRLPAKAIQDADTIRIADNGGALQDIGLKWVTAADLPRPDWIKSDGDPLLWGLWLAEHPSGQFRIQGYSMLDALAATRPAAFHYLAHHSNCGQDYQYRPAMTATAG